jgi:hypothetical protein
MKKRQTKRSQPRYTLLAHITTTTRERTVEIAPGVTVRVPSNHGGVTAFKVYRSQ